MVHSLKQLDLSMDYMVHWIELSEISLKVQYLHRMEEKG